MEHRDVLDEVVGFEQSEKRTLVSLCFRRFCLAGGRGGAGSRLRLLQ